MNIQDLTFPEEEHIITKNRPLKVKTPPALKFITSLLYNSGAGLSLVYFICIFVIQPLLEVQYERRSDFLTFVLLRARKFLNVVALKRNLPVVAIRRGEKLYSDAATQTTSSKEEEQEKEQQLRTALKYGVTFEDQVDEDGNERNLISGELSRLQESLEHYNKTCGTIDELNPFLFQIKKLQGNIDAYGHATLFKTGRKMAGTSSSTTITNDIRTIKGWYLNGQI